MKRYRVIISPAALDAMAAYRDYIAHASGSDEAAARWVGRVVQRLEHLKTMPDQFALAEENAHFDVELRRMLIGRYVATYTIEETDRAVRIVGFRHGAKRPDRD